MLSLESFYLIMFESATLGSTFLHAHLNTLIQTSEEMLKIFVFLTLHLKKLISNPSLHGT